MKILYILPVIAFVLGSCKKDNSKSDNVVVITASGSIEAKMDEFRTLIGGQLNTTVGATEGRREVNWDGVPDELLDKTLPLDFFNPTAPGSPQARQRGINYPSGAGSFMVSNSGFSNINAKASASFKPFSGTNTFANVGAKAWDMKFQVPGQNVDASIEGFGAVFSDVDVPNSTSLEFFNGDRSIGKYYAPIHDTTTSFSFLAVYFQNGEKVTSIKVRHQGILSDGQNDVSDGGSADLIVLDDFIYSEPIK
jgi:hypothetical protein